MSNRPTLPSSNPRPRIAEAGPRRALTGRRALVTGARGFIGSRLVRSLLDDGAEVHVLIRPDDHRPVHAVASTRGLAHRITWHRCDLVDVDAVQAVFREIAPEVVFHLASRVQGHRDLALALPMLEDNTRAAVNISRRIRSSTSSGTRGCSRSSNWARRCPIVGAFGTVPHQVALVSWRRTVEPVSRRHHMAETEVVSSFREKRRSGALPTSAAVRTRDRVPGRSGVRGRPVDGGLVTPREMIMGVPEILALLAVLIVAVAGVTVAALAVLHPDREIRARAVSVLTLLFSGRRPKGQ
ncbi:NAD-dependent epimerase/dehydratase family protein [Actinomycetospora soli]|uniref:NAD-dependent epimerase/dehydratase family protein n=1 Tax=Actinomycetospora soli TaxID=2893887 RepID=UPI001E3A8C47|nr:NAD-dependent epimerase/dehydratase family protein [Actinomycetospora soli]MCD2191107.1 NAD-dependent epimerase/dehydratase family protein [Actinomycetospora soli]